MNDPSPSSRHIERLLVPTLALLFAVALVPFASVHPLPRLVLGSMGALVGAAAVWVGLRGRSLAWPGLVGLLLLLLALALNATSLWPIDAATREGMQPVVAGPVNAVLALVGQPVHSLALDPARALGAVQLSLGVGLAGLGVLALVRSLDRARGFAWILVTAGVLTTVLATLHWATGATSIYWISGVPSYARDPFFAPFVSPNQGGAACAALIPLALALMLRKDLGWRLAAMGAAAVLVMGVAASGSRGAILEAVVAGVVFGLLLGSRTVQLLVGLALAAGLGALIHHGPYALAYRFSTWISPDWFDGDLLLGRGGIWHATARLAGGAPLLGVGAGSYEDAYQIVKTMPEFTTTSHAHQDYLQALAEQGLVGGGAWILLALLPVIAGTLGCLRLHRGRRRSLLAGYVAALVALLVCAAVDFPAHIGALAVLYALLAGVSLARAGRSLQPRAGRGLGWSGRLTRLLAPALALVAPSSAPRPTPPTSTACSRPRTGSASPWPAGRWIRSPCTSWRAPTGSRASWTGPVSCSSCPPRPTPPWCGAGCTWRDCAARSVRMGSPARPTPICWPSTSPATRAAGPTCGRCCSPGTTPSGSSPRCCRRGPIGCGTRPRWPSSWSWTSWRRTTSGRPWPSIPKPRCPTPPSCCAAIGMTRR
jgi:O-antigen ligase